MILLTDMLDLEFNNSISNYFKTSKEDRDSFRITMR